MINFEVLKTLKFLSELNKNFDVKDLHFLLSKIH